MSLWIKQRGFKKEGDLTYFKRDLKYVNEEGLGWLQFKKKEKEKEWNVDITGGQLV